MSAPKDSAAWHDGMTRTAAGKGSTQGKAPGGISRRNWTAMLALIEEGLTPVQAAARRGLGARAVEHLTRHLFS